MINTETTNGDPPDRGPNIDWKVALAPFLERTWSTAVRQLLNTALPYIVLFGAMVVANVYELPYWITLVAAVPAGLFMVRTFIIFHDCTHESFLPSRRANRIVGFITGVLTLTPYEPWRMSHLKHHATNGQLDHRGTGDVYTMTVDEYRSASPIRRIMYRLYRNPVVLFLIGPSFIFLGMHRFSGLRGTGAERRSLLLTNIALAGVVVSISIPFGFTTYIAVQLPIMVVGGAVGVWLFYVQHQFHRGYWAHDGSWNRTDAALSGASCYVLPPILRWFTGNIGFHNLHHLQPRIPNYRLHRAYLETPAAKTDNALTIRASLRSLRIKLWSESNNRFMSFRQALRST